MNSSAPLLVVDVGNTSTTVARYEHGAIHDLRRYGPEVEPSMLLREAVTVHHVRGLGLCSVVPAMTSRWLAAVDSLPVVRVGHTVNLGVPITYPHPASIGADRLANAVAAVERHGYPVIVADFGTALTFDVVVSEKGYIGGVIAPGLPLMFQYLHEKTALLPAIGPENVKGAIGDSTERAMRIGAQIGYRGMVREILEAIEEELGLPEATICATGGDAAWVLRSLQRDIHEHPDLTLFGTARIYEQNERP